MRSTKTCISLGLAAVMLWFGGSLLLAQDEETVYARIGSWDVKRTHWKSVVGNFEKNTMPILQRLFDDGVLIEWGMDANSVHEPDGYTHSMWWSAKDLAGVEKVLDALDAASGKLSEEEQAKNIADLSDSILKHRDMIVRSLEFASRPAKLDGGYGFTSHVRVERGKAREYLDLWRKYSKPIYEQLLADGVIVSYGLDVEAIHTNDPSWRTTWYVVPSLEDDKKVEDAFDSAWDKRSQEERDAIQAAFREVTVDGTHRDGMNRIVHYASK